MDELGELITQYCQRSDTHENRYMRLMRKHSDSLIEWSELIKEIKGLLGYSEKMASLAKQNNALVEEISEVYSDLAEDSTLLIKIYELIMMKRTKEEHGTP